MELTKKDVIGMIAMMKSNYPYAYKQQSKEETNMLVNTWCAIFCKYPREIVQSAFYKSLEICKMPPTIADLTEIINLYKQATEKSENDLWSELRTAVYKTDDCVYRFRFNAIQPNGKTQGENARDEFDEIWNNLSPELKEYLSNKNTLIELSRQENLEYEKARFIKILPIVRNRIKVKSETNPALLEMIKNNYLIDGSFDIKKIEG